VRRDDAVGRLVPVHAAHVRREADRAPDVGPDLERGEPAGERRGGTARRPAGGAGLVPGVRRRAEDLVVALHVAGVDRQVRLAEDHRTVAAQRGDRPCVLLGHVPGQFRCARRGAHPGGGEAVLDRHRHTVQRPVHVAGGEGRVGGVGLPTGAVGVEGDDAVDRSVEPADPVEEVFERSARGRAALPDRCREFDRTEFVQFGHGRSLRRAGEV